MCALFLFLFLNPKNCEQNIHEKFCLYILFVLLTWLKERIVFCHQTSIFKIKITSNENANYLIFLFATIL